MLYFIGESIVVSLLFEVKLSESSMSILASYLSFVSLMVSQFWIIITSNLGFYFRVVAVAGIGIDF